MPQDQEYESRKAATEAAVIRLAPKAELTREVLAELVDRLDLVEHIERESGSPLASSNQPALVGRFRYVIRNDEILKVSDFLALVKATSGVVVGLLSTPTPAGIKSVIDGVHGLYVMFAGILKRGSVLPEQDFAVVAALQRLKSATPNTLAEALNNAAGHAIADGAGVEATLTRYELRNDNRGGFTRRGESGMWSLIGV